MRRSILRQIEEHAYRIGDKAQRADVDLVIDAKCGKNAWLQCKQDPEIWRALVQSEGPHLTGICYGLIWPVEIRFDPKLPEDLIQLRDQNGRLLIELLCGETVESAPLGLMTAGE